MRHSSAALASLLLTLSVAPLAHGQLVPGGALVPGGGGRARSFGYVREPGQGFWVSGSAFDDMSGVYMREEHATDVHTKNHEWGVQLFYRNRLTNWVMAISSSVGSWPSSAMAACILGT